MFAQRHHSKLASDHHRVLRIWLQGGVGLIRALCDACAGILLSRVLCQQVTYRENLRVSFLKTVRYVTVDQNLWRSEI